MTDSKDRSYTWKVTGTKDDDYLLFPDVELQLVRLA